MKHLKKFFESKEITKEEILDNLIFINDEFGEPQIRTIKFANSNIWEFVWNIEINFTYKQSLDSFFSKVQKLSELTLDFKSAQARLEDWDFEMYLSGNFLKLELIPKDTGPDKFEFISNYDARTLFIKENEIRRFFKSRAVKILKLEETWNEVNEQGDLIIHLDKQNSRDVIDEFRELFRQEYESREDEFNRSYGVEEVDEGVGIVAYDEEAIVSLC